MEPTIYTPLKVNNEIELCKVYNRRAKEHLESYLLGHGVSYYIKWPKRGFFSRRDESCIFCINNSSKDAVSQAILEMPEEIRNEIDMLLTPSHNDYL